MFDLSVGLKPFERYTWHINDETGLMAPKLDPNVKKKPKFQKNTLKTLKKRPHPEKVPKKRWRGPVNFLH